jgi:hypothetical protein
VGFGAGVNNIWPIGSPSGTSDRTNQLFLNPFFNYHVADGWSVGSSREITANWIAATGSEASRSAAALARRFTSADRP